MILSQKISVQKKKKEKKKKKKKLTVQIPIKILLNKRSLIFKVASGSRMTNHLKRSLTKSIFINTVKEIGQKRLLYKPNFQVRTSQFSEAGIFFITPLYSGTNF